MIVISSDPTGLAHTVASQLGMPIIQMKVIHFADGELHVSLPDPSLVANQAVTIINSTGYPVNEQVLVLAFMAQELKNAGANQVRAIIPYFGYERQEASDIAGKPGHGAVIARLLEAAGCDGILIVEVHAKQLLSFFGIPTGNISLTPFLAQHISHIFPDRDRICLVAPDHGAHERVNAIAQLLGVPMLTFTKERYAPDTTRIVGHQGACEGKEAIIIDDIIATGGTALHAAENAQKLGCSAVHGYFIHPVLPGDAYERLQSSIFSKIFVTNTLALPERAKDFKLGNKFQVLDISDELVKVLLNNY